MTELKTSLTSPRSQKRGYYQTVECDDPHYENRIKNQRLSSDLNFAYFDKQYGEVLEVNKNREVRRGLKERFLELHEKAQKWEILAYHLKVICAENPEIEPLPDLENDAYLKREEAYLTIVTVSKLFKHLEFVSQQHPDYNSFQCKQLKTSYANCWKLVFSSSYAGCFLPCLLVLLFLRVGRLCLFWGMVMRGCVRRDLC